MKLHVFSVSVLTPAGNGWLQLNEDKSYEDICLLVYTVTSNPDYSWLTLSGFEESDRELYKHHIGAVLVQKLRRWKKVRPAHWFLNTTYSKFIRTTCQSKSDLCSAKGTK